MLGTCRRGGGQGCSAIAGHVSCEARGRVGRLMDGEARVSFEGDASAREAAQRRVLTLA